MAAESFLLFMLSDRVRTASPRVTHRAGILPGLFDCFPVDGTPSFSVAGRTVNLGFREASQEPSNN